MSKERELLKQAEELIDDAYEGKIALSLCNEIKEFLAQPEQEPTTRYALDSYWNQEAYQRGYAEAKRKLKREPLINKYVLNAFKADDEATHPYSYWAGVEFAEKYHGIGGGE